MKLTKIISACAVMALSASAFAITGKEVVQMALDVKEPDFSMSQVYMDLIDKNGNTERREIMEYGRSVNDLKTVVIVFNAPAAVKNTRFLQQEVDKGDDKKAIWMPSLGGDPRNIAASEGSSSFMGSDATYDDMSTREIDEDTHELMAEGVNKNGFTCYQVKSTPVDPKSSQYSYRIQWIDKATNVPVYAEMYDKKGKLLKTLTVEKLQKNTGKTGNTYNTPMSTLLENVQTGHSTRMIINKIQLDSGIPGKVFTKEFLRTGKIQ